MKKNLFVLALWLFPYNIFGEEAGSYFLFGLLAIYLISGGMKRLSKENTIYEVFLGLMLVLSIATAIFSTNSLRSLTGIAVYGAALLALFVFKEVEEDFFIKNTVYITTVLAAVSIIYQGLVQDTRIFGNLGYANTYALILFAAIVFSEMVIHKKMDFYIKLTLFTALMFTGDRTMLVILVLWVIFRSVRERNARVAILMTLGVLQYLLFSKIGIAAIFLAPIIVLGLKLLFDLLTKVKKRLVIIAIPLALAVMFFSGANTFERIANIGLTNASLMERVISFEDVLKLALEKPFGHGANSYEYGQYLYKSAFYESKYIHNSILQHLYDFGFVGALLFMILFMYGLFIIFKTKSRYREFYMAVYVAIFFHGLLNFDLVFPITWIIVSSIIAYCCPREEINQSYSWLRVSLVGLLLFSIFLTWYEGTLRMAESAIKTEKYNTAGKLLHLQADMTVPDERKYQVQAAIAMNHSGLLKAAEKSLEKAERANRIDPRIKWNRIVVLTALKKYHEAEKLWGDVLAKERYNRETYRAYYYFLQEAYADHEPERDEKIRKLKEAFENYKEQINSKADLLPNQLPDKFEEAIQD